MPVIVWSLPAVAPWIIGACIFIAVTWWLAEKWAKAEDEMYEAQRAATKARLMAVTTSRHRAGGKAGQGYRVVGVETCRNCALRRPVVEPAIHAAFVAGGYRPVAVNVTIGIMCRPGGFNVHKNGWCPSYVSDGGQPDRAFLK